MGRNIGKILNSKHGQKFFYHAKQSATNSFTTNSTLKKNSEIKRSNW